MAWVPLAAMGASMLADKFLSKDKLNKVPTMSKGQQGILNQLMQMIQPQGQLGQGMQQSLSYQQQLMDPSSQAVNQFVQPYMDQFNNQTVPGLAERFAGYGGLGGGLSSSGFGQSLSAAGGQLQNQLAALKAGLGQKAAQSLMNQYGQLSGSAMNAQPFGYAKPQMGQTQGYMDQWGQQGYPGLQQGAQSLGNLFSGIFGGSDQSYLNNMWK